MGEGGSTKSCQVPLLPSMIQMQHCLCKGVIKIQTGGLLSHTIKRVGVVITVLLYLQMGGGQMGFPSFVLDNLSNSNCPQVMAVTLTAVKLK